MDPACRMLHLATPTSPQQCVTIEHNVSRTTTGLALVEHRLEKVLRGRRPVVAQEWRSTPPPAPIAAAFVHPLGKGCSPTWLPGDANSMPMATFQSPLCASRLRSARFAPRQRRAENHRRGGTDAFGRDRANEHLGHGGSIGPMSVADAHD